MTLRKKIIYTLICTSLPLVFLFLTILGLDLYCHHKFNNYAGLNIWGYRGQIASKKKPGEIRIAVLGGSTAFGYGVHYSKAFPALLESQLNLPQLNLKQNPISVINLAFNDQGSYSFLFTLKDYEYLDYDVAVLYEGYNDIALNRSNFRHFSPIFLATGYYPILPMILREKALAILYKGDLEKSYQDAYYGKKTVFKLTAIEQGTADFMMIAADATQSLEKQFGKLTAADRPKSLELPKNSVCETKWSDYCNNMELAINFILNKGKKVLIVTQPYIGTEHIEQQKSLNALLRNKYSNQPSVQYVNLGNTVDLKDKNLQFDGMHLTAKGNEIIANALVDSVRKIISESQNNIITQK